MKEKEIFIFTNIDGANEAETEYVDNYINQLLGRYTLIMTEDNQNALINEEEDAFMIMEYK